MSTYSNELKATDSVLQKIADYVCEPLKVSKLSEATAKYCLMDSLGCAILALKLC